MKLGLLDPFERDTPGIQAKYGIVSRFDRVVQNTGQIINFQRAQIDSISGPFSGLKSEYDVLSEIVLEPIGIASTPAAKDIVTGPADKCVVSAPPK